MLEADRLAGVHDAGVYAEDLVVGARNHLTPETADDAIGGQPGLRFERPVDLQEAEVHGLAAGIADDLAEGKALIHRVKQRPGLRLAPGQPLGRRDPLVQVETNLTLALTRTGTVKLTLWCLDPSISGV